jgi:4-hydroxyphenylpyruvate dioxygenase-like putative hemolysin
MNAADPLFPQRYLHTIHAAAECSRLREIYINVFGGITFHEGYYDAEDRDAALIYVGDHMIEVMAPRNPADTNYMFARYVAKAGPGYHSISFRVADVEAAHERCSDLGVRINTKWPGLIFLHPKSTGGIIMELTDHMMPNDPWDLPNWRADWAAGRPQKPNALSHIVCAPRDPETAIAFLTGALSGTAHQPETVEWPEPATSTRVDVADISLVVLDPLDKQDGPLARYAAGTNGGVYALAWHVEDAGAATEWFATNHNGAIPMEALPEGSGYSHAYILDGARHWFVERKG